MTAHCTPISTASCRRRRCRASRHTSPSALPAAAGSTKSALITRAGELLALAAPPDRELPPFRAGDVKPLTRLWWKVRLPLAWAATVVVALGIGTYLGKGVEQVPQAPTASDTQPVELKALQAPISSDTVQRESRAWRRRGAARTPPATPAAPAPAA